MHGSSHDLSLFGNALSVISAHAAGARVVWHLHEDLAVVAFPGQRRLSQTAFSIVVRCADAVVVLSDASRAIASRYINPRHLAVLPPTCAPDLLDIPLERPPREHVTILFVGWLTAAKGIYDLVDAAALVGQQDARVRFVVAGSGMTDQETASVRAAIDQRGLQNVVRLCGVVTGADKQRLFADADVLYLPTHWDAFPVVVLEAMAAGLPVVSTCVGGLPSMVEPGQGALLGPVGDAPRQAEHLLTLAAAPAQRQAMGRVNRERFRATSHPDVVGQAAVDLYRRVLAH